MEPRSCYVVKKSFSVLVKTEISHHFFLKQGPTKKFAFMKFFDLFSKILSLFYGRNVKEVMDRKRPDRFSWDRGLFLMFLDGELHIKNSGMFLEKKS